MKFQLQNGQQSRAERAGRAGSRVSGLHRFNSRRAFTLIELMVAIMLFTVVIAAICATLILVLRATQVGQEASARSQRQRVVMNTIENSLMCVQSFQASQQYYTFIAVNGDSPVLSFAARLPEVFPRNNKFSNPEAGRDFNLRRVTFTLEPGQDRENNLVLRQQPILMAIDPGEQNQPLIVAKNVQKFIVECWDTNQLDWVDEWDNTNTLPPMIRIGLVLGVEADNNNKNSNFRNDDSQPPLVRVFSLPSTTMPAAVQLGGAGGGFGQRGGLPNPVIPQR